MAKKVSAYRKVLTDTLKYGKGGFFTGKADWTAVELLTFNNFDKDIAQVL